MKTQRKSIARRLFRYVIKDLHKLSRHCSHFFGNTDLFQKLEQTREREGSMVIDQWGIQIYHSNVEKGVKNTGRSRYF